MHRALPSRILLLVLWSASAIPAQDSEDPELLYQKAVHWEVVEGDLERALELYRKVTLLSSVSRSTAARALLRTGRCLEKLGRADASRIYLRILDEYGDQPGIAHQARLSLERLGTGQRFPKSSGSTLRFVLADERLPWWLVSPADFDFSPDGERLVFRARVDGDFERGVSFSDDLGFWKMSRHLGLFMTDRTGSLVRPLVRDWGPWRFPASPRWSPDGQMICYLAATNAVRESGRPEEVRGIFVVPAKGGEQRRIGPYLSAATSQVFWSPEGLLTYLDGLGLHTIDLDGRLHSEVAFEADQAVFGGYSSDGRWLVFHNLAEFNQHQADRLGPNTDIWIMPSTGGRAIPITRSPKPDRFPAWDTRKNSIYFVSSRDGDPNIWEVSLDLQTGTRLGEPRQVTAYRGATIVRLQVIAQKNEVAFGLVRKTSVINVTSTDLSGDPRTVAKGSRALLSLDGRTVYFVGGEEGQPGIFAVSSAGGEPRQLTDTAYGSGFDLSPDGQTLVFLAPTREGKGIFRLPVSGGSPELLVELENRSGVHPHPRWSPNGDLVAYAFNGSLNVIPAGGGQEKKLAQLGWHNPTIRWSPDGDYLAGLGYRDSEVERWGVFVVRLSDGQVRRLTSVEEHHWKEGLEWHPSGQELTFMDYRKDGIRKAYLDGRSTHIWLDLEEHWDYKGTWTPAGDEFFFSTTREYGRMDLYRWSAATDEVQFVAADVERLASFSRDGRTMAWTSLRMTKQIWLLEQTE